VVNQPGTLLVIPVADLAQHVLLRLCYLLQDGYVITDDVHHRPVPGIDRFREIVDVERSWPLTLLEQISLSEITAECATSCFAGSLMLQAMGLGGWLFNGIDPAICARKFGPGGPFHPDTPGPWKDSRKVRSAAQVHDEMFRQCIAHEAQYVFDTFGKFPATIPSIFATTYLQAQHLDTEFYDRFYEAGAYLRTHAAHMEQWHSGLE
jgi:hypothetical protein